MTREKWREMMGLIHEIRQAERARGGLMMAVRRCKEGSAKCLQYWKRIDDFERDINRANDKLTLEFMVMVTLHENAEKKAGS